MTRDETIALWQKCEDARAAAVGHGKSEDEAHEAAKAIWNGWANRIRAKGQSLLESNQFELLDRANESRIAWRRRHAIEVQNWLDEARVDFSNMSLARISDKAVLDEQGRLKKQSLFTKNWALDFDDFIFPGEADFTETEFHSSAIFDHALFYCPAWFRAAIFHQGAYFVSTTFHRDASFFTSSFKYAVNLTNGHFIGRASFTASKFLSIFDLTGTIFERVPRFNQSQFDEAPDLDNVEFPILNFWRHTNQHYASNYRALRRIAIQGHDHELEARAFKGEIRSKRGTEHKWWHAAFWFGILYDSLSDFGRSMMRPFYLWFGSIGLFCGLYLAHAGKLSAFSASCPDGTAHWLKSLIFALKNAILFVNWDRAQIHTA